MYIYIIYIYIYTHHMHTYAYRMRMIVHMLMAVCPTIHGKISKRALTSINLDISRWGFNIGRSHQVHWGLQSVSNDTSQGICLQATQVWLGKHHPGFISSAEPSLFNIFPCNRTSGQMIILHKPLIHIL